MIAKTKEIKICIAKDNFFFSFIFSPFYNSIFHKAKIVLDYPVFCKWKHCTKKELQKIKIKFQTYIA